MTKCAAASRSPVLSSSVCGPAKRARAQELELAARKLLPAVICEVLNQGILARHDLREVEADMPGADAPRRGVAGQVQNFRGVEQRFGRHAAAQDAEPANLLSAFDQRRPEPRARGGPPRGIPRAAGAYDGKIIFVLRANRVHAGRMCSAQAAGKAPHRR